MESNQQAAHGAPATIVLGGGCFWCTDAVFSQVRGVRAVECGYANGHLPQPRYEQVCTGKTGHAEVVRVQFDAKAITLRELLLIFLLRTTRPRATAKAMMRALSTAVPSTPLHLSRPR